MCKGALRALAKAGVVAKPVPGRAAGTEWATTARERGGGQGRREGHRGQAGARAGERRAGLRRERGGA